MFAQILILSRTYAPPTIPHTIAMTTAAFWMNGSFDEGVLQEISGARVETMPRGIKATYIVSGKRDGSGPFRGEWGGAHPPLEIASLQSIATIASKLKISYSIQSP